MRKWSLAAAAAALVIIGCGGGGGGGSSTGTTSTTGTPGQSSVTLPNTPGLINFVYLTGAQRAPAESSVVINRAQVSDTLGPVFKVLQPEVVMQLDGYRDHIVPLSVPTLNSRFFSQYNLNIKELRLSDGTPFQGPEGSALVDEVFPASIRALPGRQTTVSLRLNDTMFDDNANFDRTIFEEQNLNPDTGTINGFFSDYVMFDISNMDDADKPDLNGGGKAERIYVSGDNFAMSGSDSTGSFEVLTPFGFTEGTYSAVQPLTGFGTYTLLQPDPRDLDGIARIASIKGIWRPLNSVVSNMSTFEMIAFPRANDDTIQDVILISRSGNTITNMYFGQIDYTASGGDPQLKAYPIRNMDDADASEEIVGNLSGFLGKSGQPVSAATPTQIFSGQFSLSQSPDSNGGPVPAEFPTTGRFIVFRI